MGGLTREELERRIDQALGHAPADLVVRGARVLNTATGGIARCDIAVCGPVVVALGEGFRGREVIEARGRFAVPGFIDAHVHIESAMVTPDAFARAVLPRGTTTAVWDPHELANVLGVEAIRYGLACAEVLPLSLFVALSSCVPACELETSGARLELEDLRPFADHPAVIGLAELMNFPGVLAKEPRLLAKAAAFADRHIDGHAPLLSGRALDAYLAVGVRTDHESSLVEEAQEKLEKGVHLLLREGSVARDVTTLAPLLGDRTWMRLAFCSDDRNPIEIRKEGHIDHALRLAIRAGAPVVPAYRAASLGAALAFGMRDRGIIAPGYRADFLLLDDLEEVVVTDVVCGGRRVTAELFGARPAPEPPGQGSVRRDRVTERDLEIPGPGPTTPVIGALPFSLVTEHRIRELPWRDGLRLPDPARGILALCVLERHGRNGNIGRGFVEGFGPLDGAIASSVAHDSHNLVVAGSNARDMAVAVNRLIDLQGGAVVVHRGEPRAELPLPVAGLMSDRGLDFVESRLRTLREAARAIGCVFEEPLLQLAFLTLAVIPHLKLTDMGYVTAGPEGLRLLRA